MMNTLHNYIKNYSDPKANFALGQEYESRGQTGAALSFYLRTAERADNDMQQYEALLRCALCLERQKTRDDTEKVLLQKAISLIPDRPEAYFLLSRLYERMQQWQDCYTISVIGLKICNNHFEPLSTNVEYVGIYSLLFQKGVSAWWIGHCEEAREIMSELMINYGGVMNEVFSKAVNQNIKSIGHPVRKV